MSVRADARLRADRNRDQLAATAGSYASYVMTAGAGARRRRRSERVGSWLVSHPVEIAFALLVMAAFAYSLHLTRSYFFFLDDWLLIKQGGSLGGWFRPYSDQMGLIIIGTWRVLAELFGFTFTPFRVVGMVGLYAVPAAYFLTTRRQFGAVLAALLALPLVWYGRDISFIPAQLDHFLVLLGAIGCAAALNRGRRADWFSPARWRSRSARAAAASRWQSPALRTTSVRERRCGGGSQCSSPFSSGSCGG